MPTASLDFSLPDSDATEALGAALARAFSGAGGAVVYLRGELGSGKTTCARSLLHALGVTATVRSPTYTLVDTYSTPALDLVHVDLYRLRSSAEVEELGLRDLTGPHALMLIEWPEQGGSAVPPADLEVQLRYAGESRAASLRAAGEAGLAWLGKLVLDRSLVPYVSNLT
ncbi:MAG TPA: tRNA (adenosine(37)-N6)-threonylcarbamoyltransferase complex ATPase subunit type 1 TsaE [Steroidobacteraceae bacterium]|jgi:tRNA threonylcarbamoyladenosine biosynthesis protein TsaE|nr:tRNA (adenosine(37)-N6)-threonylcarbamoyltransferase complex ATPase subunit type 1 TsaE [Steroidobacteraceae bacterium]